MLGFVQSSFNSFVPSMLLQLLRLHFKELLKRMTTFPRLLQIRKRLHSFESVGQFAQNCMYVMFWEGKDVLKPVK